MYVHMYVYCKHYLISFVYMYVHICDMWRNYHLIKASAGLLSISSHPVIKDFQTVTVLLKYVDPRKACSFVILA